MAGKEIQIKMEELKFPKVLLEIELEEPTDIEIDLLMISAIGLLICLFILVVKKYNTLDPMYQNLVHEVKISNFGIFEYF